MVMRDSTRPVVVGGVPIGGGHRSRFQSMTNTDTPDVDGTLAQIAVCADRPMRDRARGGSAAEALDAFERICAESLLPVIADIHFDHRLAIEAARRGAAKLRINPGNIGSTDEVDAATDAAAGRRSRSASA